MKYYGMHVKNDRIHGFADTPEGTPIFPLPESGIIKEWKPIVLTLKKNISQYIKTKGEYSDFLPSIFHLCSPPLKKILDKTKSEYDEIQWLPAIVRKEDGSEEKEYFILHFPQPYDVIDKNKTIYGSSIGDYQSIIKPVISKKLAEKHNIFTFPGREGIAVVISSQVKKAIQISKFIGIEFEIYASSD